MNVGGWDRVEVVADKSENNVVTVRLEKKMYAHEWQSYATNGYSYTPMTTYVEPNATPSYTPYIPDLSPRVASLERQIDVLSAQLDEALTVMRLVAAEVGVG